MVRDEDLQSEVVEVMGENIADAYITCPSHPKKTLGIKLPYIVLLVKNVRYRDRAYRECFLIVSRNLTLWRVRVRVRVRVRWCVCVCVCVCVDAQILFV